MFNTIRIAWKNLLRYQRRTLLTSLLITVGIVEALVIGWLYRTDKLKAHIVSNLGLSGARHKIFNYVVLQLWMYCIRFITPVALGIAIIHSLIQEFSESYSGYPISGIIVLGVGWLLVTHIFAFGLSGLPWKGENPSKAKGAISV